MAEEHFSTAQFHIIPIIEGSKMNKHFLNVDFQISKIKKNHNPNNRV